MQNLLKNCLQYSVGEVLVSITQDTDAPMHLSHNHASTGRICICVQNPIAKDSELDSSKLGFILETVRIISHNNQITAYVS